MKKVLGSQVYRRSFFLYITVIILVLTMIGMVIEESILNTSLLEFERRTAKSFEKVEEKLDDTVSAIDNYVFDLYSNSALFEDFLCFWGEDATGYMESRLRAGNYGDKIVSFPDDILKFMMDRDYHIQDLYFVTDNGINSMHLSSQGTTSFEFNISSEQYRKAISDCKKGYVYAKALRGSENMSKLLGTIIFIISPDYLLKDVATEFNGVGVYEGYRGMMQMDAQGAMSEAVFDTSVFSEQQLRYHRFERGPIERGYYSQRRGFGLIYSLSKADLFRSNSSSQLMLAVVEAAAFLTSYLAIWFHMKKDSRYLGEIIDSIKNAHNGEMQEITVDDKRHDEYSMIASELNIMSRELNEYIKKEYKFKITQQETEMKALLYQIDPHFLYNTLEIIRASAVTHGDPETADALVQLGKLYRMLVKEPEVIPISKEIALLECYLKLMEFRYEESFCYQIDVDSELMQKKTIKFWLQPLVENFFKHGFDSENPYNLVIVRGRKNDEGFCFEIIDNGLGADAERIDEINGKLTTVSSTGSTGIGLDNVIQRLRYYYGENCRISLKPSEVRGLTIVAQICEKVGW